MMMMNSSRQRRVVVGLMVLIIGARLALFALATAGLLGGTAAQGAGWVSWVLPVAMPLLIIAGMLLLRPGSFAGRAMPSGSGETALEILQKRFARGEVTTDQYEEMRARLQRDAPPPDAPDPAA